MGRAAARHGDRPHQPVLEAPDRSRPHGGHGRDPGRRLQRAVARQAALPTNRDCSAAAPSATSRRASASAAPSSRNDGPTRLNAASITPPTPRTGAATAVTPASTASCDDDRRRRRRPAPPAPGRRRSRGAGRAPEPADVADRVAAGLHRHIHRRAGVDRLGEIHRFARCAGDSASTGAASRGSVAWATRLRAMRSSSGPGSQSPSLPRAAKPAASSDRSCRERRAGVQPDLAGELGERHPVGVVGDLAEQAQATIGRPSGCRQRLASHVAQYDTLLHQMKDAIELAGAGSADRRRRRRGAPGRRRVAVGRAPARRWSGRHR